jgi:hypothetical protein
MKTLIFQKVTFVPGRLSFKNQIFDGLQDNPGACLKMIELGYLREI